MWVKSKNLKAKCGVQSCGVQTVLCVKIVSKITYKKPCVKHNLKNRIHYVYKHKEMGRSLQGWKWLFVKNPSYSAFIFRSFRFFFIYWILTLCVNLYWILSNIFLYQCIGGYLNIEIGWLFWIKTAFAVSMLCRLLELKPENDEKSVIN